MKVLVVYHSMYGHIFQMARAVGEGVQSVEGAELVLRRAEEFAEVKARLLQEDDYFRKAWEQQKDIPACTMEDLAEADGLLLGSPTRYGNMTAQMKRLVDGTVQLWLGNKMEGKPVGLFTSTATTHGGQESTLLTMMVPMLHLGMLVVGVPYSTPGMLHTEGRGGTPYGATTVAGSRNELQPRPEDLKIAHALGKRVAEVAKLVRGRQVG